MTIAVARPPVGAMLRGWRHFAEVAAPLRLRDRSTELWFISTRTSFGNALDATVGELSIESFLPTDERSADSMGVAPRDTRRDP